ncbi:hypothetical protein [Thiospirillum jenense]|uniref:Uncharacterized protein n=1 Tax=Thiospirillum jenense TaxID=1653858 RepID=A0A839HC86_9GAMM|nr:hypothetical protein [Thiospirillum jenense]MBB1126585.1 hypothetical protein [Thiospirillum jenense]
MIAVRTVNSERLLFLIRVVRREVNHLNATATRLFAQPLTLAQINSLAQNEELAERIEAFVGRFGRLQDTLGDKLLPNVLHFLGEKTNSLLDNLDKAERFGWLESSDVWMSIRALRNYMVHEYIEDPMVLLDALNQAYSHIPHLLKLADALITQIESRFGVK